MPQELLQLECCDLRGVVAGDEVGIVDDERMGCGLVHARLGGGNRRQGKQQSRPKQPPGPQACLCGVGMTTTPTPTISDVHLGNSLRSKAASGPFGVSSRGGARRDE